MKFALVPILCLVVFAEDEKNEALPRPAPITKERAWQLETYIKKCQDLRQKKIATLEGDIAARKRQLRERPGVDEAKRLGRIVKIAEVQLKVLKDAPLLPEPDLQAAVKNLPKPGPGSDGGFGAIFGPGAPISATVRINPSSLDLADIGDMRGPLFTVDKVISETEAIIIPDVTTMKIYYVGLEARQKFGSKPGEPLRIREIDTTNWATGKQLGPKDLPEAFEVTGKENIADSTIWILKPFNIAEAESYLEQHPDLAAPAQKSSKKAKPARKQDQPDADIFKPF